MLRQVSRGEVIEITDRGRPVALLGPVPEGTELERLRDARQVRSADGDLEDLPEPLRIPEGQEASSATLARLRRNER